MKLINRQVLADEAPQGWAQQYASAKPGSDKRSITLQLAALLRPIDPDSVDRITGNDSWTTPHCCDECGEYPPVVMQVGQEPDYESNTAHMCQACLRKALALLDAQP